MGFSHIQGNLNQEVHMIRYHGIESETGRIIVDNDTNSISVEVFGVSPHPGPTSSELFIAYSPYPDGTDFTLSPQNDSKYLGLALSDFQPTDKTKYKWVSYSNSPASLIKIYAQGSTGEKYCTEIVDNAIYYITGFSKIEFTHNSNNIDVSCYAYIHTADDESRNLEIKIPDGLDYFGENLHSIFSDSSYEMSIDTIGGVIGILKRW